MILMAIDHAAYFIGKVGPGEVWDLPLPDYPNTLAFLTRYITHLCAPGFSLLLGIGLVLYANARFSRGWSQAKIALYLVRRGLALIVLEQVLDNPPWLIGEMFSSVPIDHYRAPVPTPPSTGAWLSFSVLFELGCSMIVGGCLLRLASAWLLMLSLALLATSQWLVVSLQTEDAPVSAGLRLLFVPGATGILDVSYPMASWIAISNLGMVLGRFLLRDEAKACRAAGLSGLVLLAVFLWLRGNGFGDVHPATGAGWIDFLRVTKYPPSPAYLCLTLGGNLVLMGVSGLARKTPGLLPVYGRSALFFYFAHTWLFCLVGLVFPAGLPLWWIYPFWLSGLVLLYPACLGFARFKRGKPLESMWRML